MSYAIPVHVALVDETGSIDTAELQTVAGALNEQVQADFAPTWHVRATVGVYASAAPTMWQIVIQQKLDEPGALGYHTDDTHNQPISYVMLTHDWTVTVSHELLEMLADPYGNRMHSARLPRSLELDFAQFGLKHATSRVHYLLEVGDPCEATSYDVGGIAVTDFLLPAWYRSSATVLGGYSHAGGCAAPREVADGGYVSFCNTDGEWFQAFAQGGHLQVQDLGKFDRAKHATLREFTDTKSREYRAGPPV